mgnify:FL=1
MKFIGFGWLMFISFLLLLMGVVIPFMMIMEVIKTTFFLSFLSFFLSLVGVIVGIVGSLSYAREKRLEK